MAALGSACNAHWAWWLYGGLNGNFCFFAIPSCFFGEMYEWTAVLFLLLLNFLLAGVRESFGLKIGEGEGFCLQLESPQTREPVAWGKTARIFARYRLFVRWSPSAGELRVPPVLIVNALASNLS